MSLREKLFSHMFFRNMLAEFGRRSPYHSPRRDFPAYFQYKIGRYQSDYYLYFPKQPRLEHYKNEIINKMREYSGYDIVRYLEFHYGAYEDKGEFIRFLHYEASEKLKLWVPNKFKLRLQSTLDWVSEKQDEQKKQAENAVRRQIEQDVRSSLDKQAVSDMDIDAVVEVLSGKISTRVDQVFSDAQEKLGSLTDSFLRGNIDLNNPHNLEKVIQLFLLMLSIDGSPKNLAEEKLFKRFSYTDLASILILHFKAFKDKKFNTVQVKITECNDRLRINNPKVKKLTEALEEFFR